MGCMFVQSLVDNLAEDAYTWGKNLVPAIVGIEDKWRKLESNLTSIQAVLLDAEEKQFTNPSEKDWLNKVQSVAWDAQDVLDTYNTNACLQNLKNTNVLRSSVSKFLNNKEGAERIDKIFERINEIANEKQNLHLEPKVHVPRPDNDLKTEIYVDKSTVFGRENDVEIIVSMLLSKKHDREGEICVLPITGIAGLGKTTLARLVFENNRVKQHFKESRVWVHVTANFNLTRIMKEMVDQLRKVAIQTDLSQVRLQDDLLGRLKDNRFFLVLDDVWTVEQREWESLLGILKQGGKGSRILITSQIFDDSDSKGTLQSYQLGYLPKEKSWELFEEEAFNPNRSFPGRNSLEAMGWEIASKCGGLPLAVKAMAGILRGNDDPKKWREILESEIWQVEEKEIRSGKTKILPALKLSYDHLPCFLKPCFSYCSIFPKGYIFDKKELVKHWMAQNYIKTKDGRQQMENMGMSYFDVLVTRSFFQLSIVDDRERFVMHDLINDLSQSISIPYCLQLMPNKQLNHGDQCRHVSILGPDVEQPVLRIAEQSKKLRTLLLPGHHLKNFGNALDRVFLELKYLRVLDLSSSTLLKLPSSIENLKLLRHLDLSKTDIKKLPKSVCMLYNLQTLKLLGCRWIHKLPKGITNLVNLQHLELDAIFWFGCSNLPPHIGRMTYLQNLHSFEVSRKQGWAIEELENMNCLSGSLHISKLENAVNTSDSKLNEKKGLDELTLEWSIRDSVVEAVDEKSLRDLQPDSNIGQLKIINFLGGSFPDWLGNGHLQLLTSLILKGCSKSKTLSLKLPNLRRLYLKGMEELDRFSMDDCNSLDTLALSICPKLNNIPSSFANLRVLKIKGCSSLTELPKAPFLQFLTLTDNRILEKWNDVIAVRAFQNAGSKKYQTVYMNTCMNLLELEVVKCPKMKALPKLFYPQKLTLRGCELLNALPPAAHAIRLQVLALHDFPDDRLVKAIPKTDSLYSLSIFNISSLSSVLKWPSLSNLNSLYIHGCEDLISLSQEDGSFLSLRSLKLLSIKKCTKLKTLPREGLPNALEYLSITSCPSLQFIGCKDILKNLGSLKDLYIEDCPQLGSLPEDGVPEALKHLKIKGCPSLANNLRRNEGQDWRKIKEIPDLEVDSP